MGSLNSTPGMFSLAGFQPVSNMDFIKITRPPIQRGAVGSARTRRAALRRCCGTRTVSCSLLWMLPLLPFVRLVRMTALCDLNALAGVLPGMSMNRVDCNLSQQCARSMLDISQQRSAAGLFTLHWPLDNARCSGESLSLSLEHSDARSPSTTHHVCHTVDGSRRATRKSRH